MGKRAWLAIACFLLQGALSYGGTCIQAVPEGYRVCVTVDQWHLEPVSAVAPHGAPAHFQRLTAPGFTSSGEVGAPERLESRMEWALESPGASVVLESVTEETLALRHPLYPRQGPPLYGASPQPFAYQSAAYTKVHTAPHVRIADTYTFRHQPALTLAIEPLRYDAALGQWRLAKEIRFLLRCEKPRSVRSGHSSAFDQWMRSHFANLALSDARALPGERLDKEKYLILTTAQYVDNPDLQTLVAHRQQACEVEVVDVKTLNKTTKEELRDYIREKMPTYLLFVGKYDDFPYFEKKFQLGIYNINVKSFIWHGSSTIKGRLKPDIATGVFWVENGQDIKNIVHKTLTVESQLDTLPKKFVGHGGNRMAMDKLPADHCDKTTKEAYDTYFKQSGFGFIEIKTGKELSDAKYDIDACNKGVYFMNYNGHGAHDYWVFGWGTNDLKKLTNTVYPFVLSCACLTGTYKHATCMAVNFLKHEKGPCAFIGSYGMSSVGQHVLNMALYDAIINKKQTYGMALLTAMNADEKVFNPKATSAAPADLETMTLMTNQYHLFGDPALQTVAAGE